MTSLRLIVGFTSLACFITTVFCQSVSSLRFVHAIFRHGDRSPTETFPSDPYGESVWLNGFGQLTTTGMEQAYHLGLFFRQRYMTTTYPGFLANDYVRRQIYTLSTDKERTLGTAYCMLAGLYPPTSSHQWSVNKTVEPLGTLWQPIAVRSLDYKVDPLLSSDVPCARYDLRHDALLESPEAVQLYNANKEFIDQVTKDAGWDESTLQNAWDTYDPLLCMKTNNFKLPDWATGDIYERLEEFELNEFHFWYHDQELIRFRAGPFLNELLNNTRYAVKKKIDPERKINFYSTHDTILAALLYALEAWNNKLPPYTSAILFELHEPEPDRYHVEVWYRNHTHENPNGPYRLRVHGCDERCPWEKFEKILSPLALDNFHEACANVEDLGGHDNSISTGGKAALILFAIVATICFAATAVWCYRKRRKDFQYSSANFTDSSAIIS